MYFEKNLELLKKYNYRITEELQRVHHENPNGKIVISQAKNGETILGLAKEESVVYLSSTYNPSSEAQRFFQDIEEYKDQSVIFLFGFSNGTYVKYLYEKNPNMQIIVYEPDINVLHAAICVMDFSDVFQKETIHIATGTNVNELFKLFAQAIIDKYNYRYIHVRKLAVYKNLYYAEYEQYLQNIREALRYMQANLNTAISSGDSSTFASIQNMRFLFGCRSGADYYHDVFPEDLPAIVVSAGPSLQKNIEVLKQAKGRALIVVVDTALKTVVKHDIKPDILFTIDSEKPVELFEVCDLTDTFVFAEMVSNPKALEEIGTNNMVFYSSNAPIWADMFTKAGSEIRTVRAGGSVATEAIANLIATGFRKIILVGQDLAYTDNKQYADSQVLSKEDLELAKKGQLLQNNIYSKCQLIKDIYGNDVYTPNDYYAYIKEIERMAYTYPMVEIIDATEGGAFKEHTTIMTLKEALEQYCKKEYDIESLLSTPKRLFEGENAKIVTEKLDEMIEHFDKMKICFDGGVAACENGKYLMENQIFDLDALRQINEIIEQIDTMYVDSLERTLIMQCVPWAEYLFYGDFYEEEKDDRKETIRLYTKSIDYYGQLSQACVALKRVAEDCKQKMQKEQRFL